MSEFTRFEVVDNIGILTLCRPPVNAVNEEMKLDIIELLESLNDGRIDVYALIIRSELEKGFCGGSDTKEWYVPEKAANVAPLIDRMQEAIFKCNVPIISAVNGWCIGLGFAMVSLTDVIIAEEGSWFMFPEVNVGTVGGPMWLTRIMQEKAARYYLMTGEKIPAEEMYRLGIVLKVTEKGQLMEEAMNVARKLAAKYPPTLWAIKTIINKTELEVQDVIEVTRTMRKYGNTTLLGGDPNKREMTVAFNEHRKPVYVLAYLEKAQKTIKETR